MKFEEIRIQTYNANMKIPENHLALYTWGNVSAFDKKEGVFAIKPSGVPYPDEILESGHLDGTLILLGAVYAVAAVAAGVRYYARKDIR